PRLQELEVLRHGAVLDVLRIGVPRQTDLGMAAVVHDRLDVWRMGGAAAVDLDPDLDAGIGGSLAARDECLAHLLQRSFDRHLPGQAIGPDLDTLAADVGCQLYEALACLDVLFHDGGVGRMELADAAATPDGNAAIGELLLDVLALLGTE